MATPAVSNLLLRKLPSDLHDQLKASLRAVSLPQKTVLYEAGETPRFAHFITSGIASVVIGTPTGDTAEVNILGSESLVEAIHLLGSTRAPTRCFMQVEGTGLRMPFADLEKLFQQSDVFRRVLLQFVQYQCAATSQIAACNRLHSAEERLARWLLMIQHRIQSDQLNLTQAFLANMLGSRRSTVVLAAGALQNSGLISYSRGKIHILDRSNLEKAACDCYPVLKNLLDALTNA